MRTKPPQGIGVMIRDVLREYQPMTTTAMRTEVNARREAKGMRPIAYHTFKRYLDKAVSIGLLNVVDREDRDPNHKGGVIEDAEMMNVYRIVRGNTMDKRWGYLPSIVAGRAF